MGTLVTEARVEGRISGSAIIADLLNRIGEKLACNNDLRQTDSYSRYAAKVTIELQLTDVDTAEVTADLVVGALKPQPPPVYRYDPPMLPTVMLTIPPTMASAVEARLGAESIYPSLERAVDGSIPEPVPFHQPNLEKPVVDPTPGPEPPAPPQRVPPKWAMPGSLAAQGSTAPAAKSHDATDLPNHAVPEAVVHDPPQGNQDGGVMDTPRQVPRFYKPAPGSRTE